VFWWGPGWGWVGGLVNAVVWILIIVAAVTLLRRELPHMGHHGYRSPALRTLEERYARGEISRDEFLERRTVLLAGPPGYPGGPGGGPAAEPPAPPEPPPPPPPTSGPPPGPASEPPGAVARAERFAGEPTQQLPTDSDQADERSESPG
jgi:putative membrane protein